ncbi:hypothetical protein [Nesterenkonia pannonica]|uniref:hypothetical protein n=1 Tax=Nesterenkonia pannonica TaxID=1548602 RepID=UPI0021646CB4|nr:hypothetical protein [Nesterenkonia pannonica]
MGEGPRHHQAEVRLVGPRRGLLKPEIYRLWAARQRRPRLTALSSPLRRRAWYRLAAIPDRGIAP